MCNFGVFAVRAFHRRRQTIQASDDDGADKTVHKSKY